MPPRQVKTPYAVDTGYYDEIQALREPSYKLNRIFNKYESLSVEVAARKLRVLPSANDLSALQAHLSRDSVVVEELERVKLQQAKRLQSLEEDIKDWRGRSKEPGAFEHNAIARDLVHLSATAAIEFLIENQNTLTHAHLDNLHKLGVDIVLPEAPNPVLYRNDLVESYPERDVDLLLKGRDGLTAMEGWGVVYDVLLERNSELRAAKETNSQVMKDRDEERREHERILKDEREASREERKSLKKEIKELADKLENQKSSSDQRSNLARAEFETTREDLAAAKTRIQYLQGILDTYRQTREEAFAKLQEQITTDATNNSTARENELLRENVSKLEGSVVYLKKEYNKLSERYTILRTERNSLLPNKDKLFLAERDNTRLESESKALKKQLEELSIKHHSTSKDLITMSESRERRTKRLELSIEQCTSLQASVKEQRSLVAAKADDLAGLQVCKTYIELIGKHLQGQPTEPQAVASNVLQTIEELKAQQQDQSMSTEDVVRALNERIEAFNVKTLENALETGQLKGQYNNECKNHADTKSDLKQERNDHSQLLRRYHEFSTEHKTLVGQLQKQVSESQSSVDQLRLDVEGRKAKISEQAGVIADKDLLIASQADQIEEIDTAVTQATEDLQEDLSTMQLSLTNANATKQEVQGKFDDLCLRVDGFKQEAQKANNIVSASLTRLELGPDDDLVDGINKLLESRLAAQQEANEAKLSTEQKLSSKDEELQKQLSLGNESLKAAQGKVEEAESRINDLERQLSDANIFLSSTRTILRLEPGTEQSVVEEHLNALVAHLEIVYKARETLGINQQNGDVLAAITKLNSDLAVATESAVNTVAETESTKEALEQVLNRIRGYLGTAVPDDELPGAVHRVCNTLGIAQGDQRVLQDVRMALGIAGAHRDILQYARDLKNRSEKHAAIVRDAKARLGITSSDDAIVDSITRWIQRAGNAEPVVTRARTLLEIDPQDGNVAQAITALKRQVTDGDRDRELVRTTFMLNTAHPFGLGVADIKSRLDTALATVSSARVSLQLHTGGDVQRAITELKQKETRVDATCQSMANSFGLEDPEDLASRLDQLRKRLGQAFPFTMNGRLDEGVEVLIGRHNAGAILISSAKQVLGLDENVRDQDLPDAIREVQTKVTIANTNSEELRVKIKLATFALGLGDNFVNGILSVKARLEAAERVVNAVRNSLQISANDDPEDDNLLSQVQQNVDDVSHVRDVLKISGELQAGVSTIKQRIDELDATILQARTSLKLVESNTELLAGIERANSEFTKIQDDLKAGEKQISEARALLELSNSVSLQQGIETVQQELSQANGTIEKSRTALELADTDLDLVEAIGKVKSEAEANEDKLGEAENEVRDARTLLELAESISLQQGIAAVLDDLTQANDTIKEARTSLDLVDTDLDLARAINGVESAAEQTKTELETKEEVITKARELLKLPGTGSLQDTIATLQRDLETANAALTSTRNALALQGQDTDISAAIADLERRVQEATENANAKQARVLEVEQQKSVDDKEALDALKLGHDLQLKSACKSLRQMYEALLWDANVARNTLGITLTSGTDIVTAIRRLKQRVSDATNALNLPSGVTLENGIAARLRELAEAQTRVTEARALLNIQNNISLANGILGLKQSLTTAEDAIQKAKGSLGLRPEVSLETGLTRWLQRLNDAEETVTEARQSLGLEAGTTVSDGLAGLQLRLKSAEDTVEEARTSLNLRTEVTLIDGLARLQTLGAYLQKTIRRLLVPGKELVQGAGDLQRYNHFGVDILATGRYYETPTWFLTMANVSATGENFAQLTERLRALMIFDGDQLDQLDVLENLMRQVDSCTLDRLNVILDLLFSCWRSRRYITIEDDSIQYVKETPAQSSLQVLVEARVLEFLIRGNAVLGCSRSFYQDAIVRCWIPINESVIDESPLLLAYKAWFESLEQPYSVNLLQELLDIVMDSNQARVCTERSGGRVLAADIMTDDSHCFLWQPGQPHGSMYAVSDLQYFVPSATTMFPIRRESGGVIATDAPFTEPMPMIFVMENMNSLFVRGSAAEYQV